MIDDLWFTPADFKSNWNTVVTLSKASWTELNHSRLGLEFDPNKQLYDQLDDLGCVKLYLVRVPHTDKVVGLCLVLLSPSLHYKTKTTAVVDVVYIRPEYRGIGSRLLSWVADKLKVAGDATLMSMSLPNYKTRGGQRLQSLGMVACENTYTKVL